MAAHLGVVRAGERSARAIAAWSRAALDRPLRADAELWVAVARDEALLLGAFQRGAGMPEAWPLARRGSGGPEVRVGPGTVHVGLAMAHPGALAACDEKRIVNRAVRPLLRALTRAGGASAPAHYFGRDWVSVAHRPAAWVGFAHDATTRRTLFEALVAVRTPFAVRERASLLGKAHATLESIGRREVDPAQLAEAVAQAYARDVDTVPLDAPAHAAGDDEADVASVAGRGDDELRADPPWVAMREEAIGTLGAGPDARGVFRVGGDLLASRDALARLEQRAGAVPEASDDELAVVVDETLAAPGVALDGVRSLRSVRDVVAAALRSRRQG